VTHLGNGDALKPARAHGQIREVVDANAWVAGWRLKLWGPRRSEVLGFELGTDAVDLDRGDVTVKASRVLLHGGTRTVADKSAAWAHRAGEADAITHGALRVRGRQRRARLPAGARSRRSRHYRSRIS